MPSQSANVVVIARHYQKIAYSQLSPSKTSQKQKWSLLLGTITKRLFVMRRTNSTCLVVAFLETPVVVLFIFLKFAVQCVVVVTVLMFFLWVAPLISIFLKPLPLLLITLLHWFVADLILIVVLIVWLLLLVLRCILFLFDHHHPIIFSWSPNYSTFLCFFYGHLDLP